MHGGNGAEFFGATVRLYGRSDVDVRKAVAVGEKKGFALGNVALDHFKSKCRHRILTGVGKRNRTVLFGVPVMKLNLRRTPKRERDVAGVPEIIAEVVLDHVAFVAEAKD